MSTCYRSVGPSGGSYALRRSLKLPMWYKESSGSWPGRLRVLVILACSALSASLEQPSNFSRRVTHAPRCPCPKSSSSVLPANWRTTENAAPFVVKNIMMCKSSLAVFQTASLEPSVSVAADGTGGPCRTRKAALS